MKSRVFNNFIFLLTLYFDLKLIILIDEPRYYVVCIGMSKNGRSLYF